MMPKGTRVVQPAKGYGDKKDETFKEFLERQQRMEDDDDRRMAAHIRAIL
tara:strand:- start:2976 stop:3125 length:150 start_codon:yes stop_codon:yes gene_type:complete